MDKILHSQKYTILSITIAKVTLLSINYLFQISAVITLMGNYNAVIAEFNVFSISNECTGNEFLVPREASFGCDQNGVCTATDSAI